MPVLIACVFMAITLVYQLAPWVEHRRFWVSPGSAFAVAGWLLVSLGLRQYVGVFGGYNTTYGSIGGVILLMLWLYLSGLVLLVGAEIDSEIHHETTRPGPSPPGSMDDLEAFPCDQYRQREAGRRR